MKARIFTTTMLVIFTLATYAQTSRRTSKDDQKNDKKTETKSTEKKDNKRTYKADDKKSTNTSRRETTQPTQRSQRESKPAENTKRESRRDNNNTSTQQPNNRTENNRRSDNNRRVETNHRSNESKVVVVNNPPHRERREYVKVNHSHRNVVVVNHPRNYNPRPVEYRRVHNVYRVPVRREVYWSINLHNDFRIFYPEVTYWRYETGYRIPRISAYDAYDYVGDVAEVYGRVSDVYYEQETDDYFLYFGDYYPYQDFTVIVPGREARSFSRRPSRFFQRAYLTVNGYITETDDKAEIVVRNARQIDVY